MRERLEEDGGRKGQMGKRKGKIIGAAKRQRRRKAPRDEWRIEIEECTKGGEGRDRKSKRLKHDGPEQRDRGDKTRGCIQTTFL